MGKLAYKVYVRLHKILEIGAIPNGTEPCLLLWPPHGQKLRRGMGDI